MNAALLAELLAARLVEEDEYGCWIWQASTDVKGYPRIEVAGRLYYVARLAWELEHGPFPEAMVLRRCRFSRRCCNPDHGELLTRREVVLAGSSPAAVGARKRYCIRGHPLSGDNITPRPDRLRRCRAREYARGRRAAA